MGGTLKKKKKKKTEEESIPPSEPLFSLFVGRKGGFDPRFEMGGASRLTR
jgi:hypothetical protein